MRKLKKEDSKLGGKGKLTDNMIDKLQNYCRIAIRSNVGNLEGMKEAEATILFDYASNDKHPLHAYWPPAESTWCGYQQGKAKGGPWSIIMVLAYHGGHSQGRTNLPEA